MFEDNINFSSDEDNPPVVDDTQLEHNVENYDNRMNIFIIYFLFIN